MCKSKIQPFIPLILRRSNILQSLLITHTPPYPISVTIPLHIIHFCSQVQEYIPHNQAENDGIPAMVQRRVVSSVDISCYDAGGLDGHVV
jgi:hypothetical protein